MTVNRATLFRVCLGIYLLLMAAGLLFGLAVPGLLTGIVALLAGVFCLLGG